MMSPFRDLLDAHAMALLGALAAIIRTTITFWGTNHDTSKSLQCRFDRDEPVHSINNSRNLTDKDIHLNDIALFERARHCAREGVFASAAFVSPTHPIRTESACGFQNDMKLCDWSGIRRIQNPEGQRMRKKAQESGAKRTTLHSIVKAHSRCFG
jgi:hypothetical protein